jgi:hypothetical protein
MPDDLDLLAAIPAPSEAGAVSRRVLIWVRQATRAGSTSPSWWTAGGRSVICATATSSARG